MHFSMAKRRALISLNPVIYGISYFSHLGSIYKGIFKTPLYYTLHTLLTIGQSHHKYPPLYDSGGRGQKEDGLFQRDCLEISCPGATEEATISNRKQ